MSHTPGPWKVDADDKPPQRLFYIRDSFGRKIAQYLAYDDHVAWSHTKAEPEHVAGNAALLAASPALLAALQVDEAMARYQWSHTTQEEFLATLTALGWPGPDVGLIGPWIQANRRAAILVALPEPAKGGE